MPKSIKNRVLLFFSFFSFLTFLVIFLNISQNEQNRKMIGTIKQMDSIHILFLDEFSQANGFFSAELINPKFYATEKSEYLNKKSKIDKQLIKMLNSRNNLEFNDFEINRETVLLSKKMDSLNILFVHITKNVLERGFVDYGIEGEMRNAIHSAEHNPEAELVAILTMRRHEKDYFLRFDSKYARLLNKTVDDYVEKLSSKHKTNQQKHQLLNDLKVYKTCFNQIVELDLKSGVKNFSGLRLQYDNEQRKILNEFLTFKTLINEKTTQRLNTFFYIYILLSAAILLFSFIMSFVVSRYLTGGISKLSININEFVKEIIGIDNKNIEKKAHNELSVLISDFNTMKQHLSRHINNLEILVDERTGKIKKQSNDIIGGITYAKFIQDALLPDIQIIEKYFPESFVFNKPKDIVSGDFFWFKHFSDKNITVLAVADCTGHGVPGAMMSMLGIAFLNEIVIRENIKSASEIIEALKVSIYNHLIKDKQKALNDGMDIAVLIFFHEKNKVQFSASNRDLVFYRNGLRTILKGDKKSLGRGENEIPNFTNTEFDLFDNDFFYLTTDGFQDQYGGFSLRRLMKKGLYAIFDKIHTVPSMQQKQYLDNFLTNWQLNEVQTDDILILGMRYDKSIFINKKSQLLKKNDFDNNKSSFANNVIGK